MTTSRLVLGAMMFGVTIDEATSFALLDRFVNAGGEWIDTADCYAFWASESGYGGDSEELIGRWLAARPGIRDRVKISTKFGAEPRVAGKWPASRTGLSRSAIRSQFEGSLRRLGTDHVELAWAHMEDRSVAIEETADAMAELVTEGTALRIGTSNHPAWLVERARAHARSLGVEPITALQHSRTFLQTRPGIRPTGQDHRFGVVDDELLDLATAEGLELWAYTPLLSGAYDNPEKAIPEQYDHPGTTRRLAVLDEVAAETGLTRGQVVLSWLCGATPATRPILGGSKVGQLEAAIEATAFELPAPLRSRLDAVERD